MFIINIDQIHNFFLYVTFFPNMLLLCIRTGVHSQLSIHFPSQNMNIYLVTVSNMRVNSTVLISFLSKKKTKIYNIKNQKESY